MAGFSPLATSPLADSSGARVRATVLGTSATGAVGTVFAGAWVRDTAVTGTVWATTDVANETVWADTGPLSATVWASSPV